MRKIQTLFFCMVLSLLFSRTAYAEEIIPEKETLEVIFAIDCSGSMKSNDPSKMGLSMVQAFIDTVQAENVKVGYVAYSDSILAFSAPESIEELEKRELLKEEIGAAVYRGDTDIGMGISYAYELLSAEQNIRQIIILISDGKTDLPKDSRRTKEQSALEVEQCVRQCMEKGVQIYTVAFGRYEDNHADLREIAAQTEAESYSVQGAEELINVLYGIFQDSLAYKIQRFSNGIYAGGYQEIKCVLSEQYLNEIHVLLLSSEPVGETTVQYGTEEIPLTCLSHYAVGKVENIETDAASRELIIRSKTDEGQDLQVYVISYSGLTPVLQIRASAEKNQEQEYQVYFRNKEGSIVRNNELYTDFSWKLFCDDENMVQEAIAVSDGIIKGKVRFLHSGTYPLCGILSDEFSSFSFSVNAKVTNTIPAGSIPEDTCTRLSKEWTLCLDDYFADADKDELAYSITDTQGGITARLDRNLLTVSPQSTGIHTVTLQISDGESTLQYTHHISVIPLWKMYWWVLVLITVLVLIILWKLLHKSRPKPERLTEEKQQNHFCGKLNAYFLRQPEEETEIPPLSFEMNKIKESKVSFGVLFRGYPEQAKALHLEDIFLTAGENRNMILYHKSKAGVMIGNTIACMQIQYNISLGDIIYITSPEGNYDLEIHYVAVFQ